MDDPTSAIAVIVVLGVVAQWVATELRIPSILLLLAFGLVAGPATGLVDPDELLGELLFPVVSLGVGLLLFEGGIGLHRSEIGAWRGVLVRLLSVGVLISWLVAAAAANLVGGLSLQVAMLFGAIMTVTGPTVIIPLLRQARLRPRVARVLRWEGICIDAVGATLAIVVLEVVVVSDEGGVTDVAREVAITAGVGIGIGLVAAVFLTLVLGRRLVADHLQAALTLVTVLGAFALANHFRHEAGLFAATAMGIAMANQRRAPVRHVIAFHESIGVLLIGGIFILLGARVEADDLTANLLPGLGVLAVLVLLARPAAVAASTARSNLSRNERLYLAGMAPRGIVAASVSALFGLRLEAAGIEGGRDLAALTFVVVAGTVVVYGLGAIPASRRLHVSVPEPFGVGIIGAPSWAVQMGLALLRADVSVLVVTTDEDQIRTARHADLLVYNGRLLHRDFDETAAALGVRLAVAVSAREELNALGAERFGGMIGASNVYDLPRDTEERDESHGGAGGDTHPRFGSGLTGEEIGDLVATGSSVELITLDGDSPRRPGEVPWWPLLAVTDGRPEVVKDGRVDLGATSVVALVGGDLGEYIERAGRVAGDDGHGGDPGDDHTESVDDVGAIDAPVEGQRR